MRPAGSRAPKQGSAQLNDTNIFKTYQRSSKDNDICPDVWRIFRKEAIAAMHHYFQETFQLFPDISRWCGLITFVARVSGLWKLTELAFIDFRMAWEAMLPLRTSQNKLSQSKSQHESIKINKIYSNLG